MKGLFFILGLVCFSVAAVAVEARSHFSVNFNNSVVAPAPTPVYMRPYEAAYYEPVYIESPSYYYVEPAPRVVYVRPTPRPTIMRPVRPVPVRQSSVGFSWGFFR